MIWTVIVVWNIAVTVAWNVRSLIAAATLRIWILSVRVKLSAGWTAARRFLAFDIEAMTIMENGLNS